MNDTIELCREISDSADIGKLVLARLIRSSRDASFRSVMADMFAGYHAILTEAKQIISAFDAADGGASMAQKQPILLGLRLNAAIDNSPSHLADMLIQGCTMSLINVARAQNEYTRADERAVSLAKRIRKADEENIRQLLKFV